ncbi:MAG: T9SS type A sorting domain-containing protein [Chitinophagaceae bacterium]|nr:T9SS type A sorting domain-containing protein [Chitinophagaceae bacterium]
MLQLREITGKILVVIVLAFQVSNSVSSQTLTAMPNTSMSDNSNGFYEYLPSGYNSGNQKYPLLLFLHDVGELGDGSAAQLSSVLTRGTAKQINDGTFPSSFTVGSKTFRYLVLIPQFSAWPTSKDIDDIINYAIDNYRIDTVRIYMTGISMGAGAMWEYAGESFNNARRISAMVPVSGANPPLVSKSQNMAAANLPVWATHNSMDGTVPVCYTQDFVNGINNEEPPGGSTAKMTIFTQRGHDAWADTYDLNFKEGGMNVYQWMLQFEKPVALPVSDLKFSARNSNGTAVLDWSSSSEINHLAYLVQRSSDGIRFETLASVPSRNNTELKRNYSYTDQTPVYGSNFYRLKMVSTTGSVSYSEVVKLNFQNGTKFTLYPGIVDNQINIKTNYNLEDANLRIIDMSGKTVLLKKLNGTGVLSVPVNLSSGMYSAVLIEKGKIIFKQSFLKR